MRILVCIDDTDDLESKATGQLAEIIALAIEQNGWGKSYSITRHQLLVHPDIPYTSHNSSMCFPADIDEAYLENLIQYASNFLASESAEGSDPGLCIAIPDQLSNPELLVTFGHRAKEVVLIKNDAYQLAQQLGIHLSEHGGTGQGVIGALAGVGLRLSGNDGRFKGSIKLKTGNNVLCVRDILSQTEVEEVRILDGDTINEEDFVMLVGEKGKVKAVLLDGKCVLPVFSRGTKAGEVQWQTCTKQQLSKF